MIRPEALAAIAEARDAGCRLAILSNELDLFYGAGFREKLPFLADFELIVDEETGQLLVGDIMAEGSADLRTPSAGQGS